MAIFIFARMFWTAISFKKYINENHPYMEVGLINQFSNSIFFNAWTFIGLVAFIAALSFVKHKK